MIAFISFDCSFMPYFIKDILFKKWPPVFTAGRNYSQPKHLLAPNTQPIFFIKYTQQSNPKVYSLII